MHPNKFAIGLNPLEYCDNSLSTFENFCINNKDNIQHWYTSPPLTWICKNVRVKDKRKSKRDFKYQLNIVRKLGQKIELAINQDFRIPILKQIFVLFLIIHFRLFYSRFDSIVCLDCYSFIIKLFFPKIPLTFSVQNNFNKLNFKHLKRYSTIVIGNKNIRNFPLMRRFKNEYNLKIELLLNCACHPLCDGRCAKGMDCSKFQRKLLKEKGLDFCVANQSIFPSELNYYPDDLIDFYKLSTRPSSIHWIQQEMDFYKDKKLTSEMNFNYSESYFWEKVCCTNFIRNPILENPPVLEKVSNYKANIWNKLTGKNVRDF